MLRLAIGWIPAGFVAGLALAELTRLNALARLVAVIVPAAILLLLAGAAADAIAITDPLAPHLLPQLTRLGTWLAIGLMAFGTLLVRPFRGRFAAR